MILQFMSDTPRLQPQQQYMTRREQYCEPVSHVSTDSSDSPLKLISVRSTKFDPKSDSSHASVQASVTMSSIST